MAQLEEDFVDDVGEERDAENSHLDDSEKGGVEDFQPVEAEGGGDVHIRVDVVDVMKTKQ